MRIRQLSLLRYGHLSDAVLDFPGSAPLCVVHGANEAGKSTALAAISDALFGFAHRTAFDFLHGAPQLRLGFDLLASDGREGRFTRRKGRSATLRDEADEVIPDTALLPFLGGAGRELFEQGFGLDGDRLRLGGRALATGGGGLGESLFAAGTGLLSLRAVQARIDEEAKSLFGSGRGKRKVLEAVEGWRQAQRQVDQLSVQPKAHREATDALAAAAKELGELQAESRELQAEASRLQRLRRVSPILLGLDTARQRLESLKDAPTIPADAEARLAAAVSERNQAALDVGRESEAIELQSGRLTGLARDATVIAAQDVIDQLAEARHAAVQAEADLPSLRLAIESHRATVAEALRELGLSVTPEDARDAIPDPATCSRVRRLAREHASLAAAVLTARNAERSAKLRCEKAEAALADQPKPFDPAILRATINMVRSEGRLDEDLAEAASLAQAASKKVLTALAALPLWSGDLDSLASCPVPLETETGLAGAAFEITKEAAHAAAAAVAKTRQELDAVDERLRRLTERGTVPTPAAVAAARLERDVTWKLVRQALSGEPLPGTPPAGELADRFELLRDQADHLADERADDAHRVAEFIAETAKREKLARQHEVELVAQSEAMAAFEGAEARWIEIWGPTGVAPTTVAAMAEWRRRRDEVLRLRGEAIEATRRHDVEAERCNTARTALLKLLPDAPSDGTVASLLARAEAHCSAAEGVLAAHNALTADLKREKDAQPDLRAACGQAEAALGDWSVKWAPAVTQLGLPETTGVEEAEAALAAWSRIAEAAPAWRQDASRVTELEQTAAAFQASVELAVTAAGASPLTEPATVVALRLIRQLEEARKAEAEAEALSKRIQEHGDALKIAQRNSEAAAEKLAELRRIARVEDDTSLEGEFKRARSRDATEADIKRLEEDLGRQGDGHDEASLRAEAIGADVDAAAARLVEIEERITALGAQREVLSDTRARKIAELEVMGRGQNAAGALQEQQQHLAEAGGAAGRYAQLHVARTLLNAGIERFRRRQQGPLLTAASKHFADLTRGRYSRLGTDLDAAGKPVLLAIRRDGTECPIDGLSEGTRDQLFLALRVAAIEAHVANSEPLPFVADDLLVHFDDERAAAAIDLLIELGRTTQVILFTHHDHVGSIAEARGSDVAVVRWDPHGSEAIRVPPVVPAVA